ncbi:flagellar assembly regulator FliX [Stappia sp. GBMRC 2046]|uniref:Flagellar assembly regulator FliX n=1 Tax=Stappia sediminis TaxID=2692190 RepID=A0A7X3LRE8_9HYPH|nr:flagellar assembly protein FliX [Stappia sediminis]MXN63715.1 flagellar assembly regulator FliX [Stappia sediminis]
MRISGFQSLSSTQAKASARRRPASGSAFAPTVSDETAQAAPAPSAGGGATVTSLSAVLALQSVEDATSGRKRALRHGNDLLDALENLKVELLGGKVAADRLERLMAMLKSRRPGDDADVEAVVDEIELRARVELAKLGRFAD